LFLFIHNVRYCDGEHKRRLEFEILRLWWQEDLFWIGMLPEEVVYDILDLLLIKHKRK